MPSARGYVRVSTDEQAQNGVSIDAQKKILQAFAVVKGFDDFEIYCDEGYSGKNLNRPDVRKLLRECAGGEVSAVVVWRLDRLSRSLRDTLEIVEDIFTPNNVTLISVTESIDTSTPSGRLMLNILASFAQSERESDAERVRMAKDAMARECKHLGGYVPLGYKVGPDGCYEIDEATAPVVREIFRMYNARMGYTSILRYIKAQGIKSPRGNDYSKATLNFLLSNEKYIGTYIHNRTVPQDGRGKRSSKQNPIEKQIRIPGGMPAIIDDATWRKACAIRAENARAGGAHKPREEFLLTGLCFCAVCGGRMVVDVGGKDRNGTLQRYYTCKNKCVPPARKEKLEEAVFLILDEVAAQEQLLMQACAVANRFTQEEAEDRRPELAALERRRVDVSKRLAAIVDYIAASGVESPQALRAEITALEAEQAKLDAAIRRASLPTKVYDPEQLLSLLLSIRQAKKKPPEQVKPLLQAALRGVYVSADAYDVQFHGIDTVELRGVEPLSESSKAKPSPSAVYGLTFPPLRVHRQTRGFSSFILQTGRKA